MPDILLHGRVPTISVVIPLFNRAGSIAATVESVLAQTVQVHEIVIVDDASRDNSVEVARALAARYPQVRLIALEQNGGGGRARNAGIDAAAGEWLALLDSDDLWMPDKLARQLAAVDALEVREVVCFTNLEVDRHDGSPPFLWNDAPFQAGGDIKRFKLEQDQVVQTSTLLMPTALARDLRFRDTLRRGQDEDLIYRAGARGVTFVYVDVPLVRYSADATVERISARKNLVPQIEWLEVAREYLSDAERAAYYMRHMFAFHLEDDRAAALRYSFPFLRGGHIAPMRYAKIVVQSAVPVDLRRRLKRMLARG